MPDWQSTAELVLEGAAFAKFMHALAGLYFWEVAMSLDFDWEFISGKKKFHWPLIFYFLGRYFLVAALIGILVALDVTQEVNCQTLYTFNQLVGQSTLGFASINLAIRTMALWSQNMYIVVPLVIIILGHWSLILQGALLKAAWVPEQGCVITQTNNTVLAATFIYGMCFDLVVLVLTAAKLAFQRGQRSQLMKMLFRDGLIYFVIAFVASLLATTFMLLNLNAIMSVIFNVPSAVASTIVACRAVRRLNEWKNNGPEVFSSGNQSRSGGAYRPGPVTSNRGPGIHYPQSRSKVDGVHVQMETFAVAEGGAVAIPQKTFDSAEDPEAGSDYKQPI
ncbi:hypothetical protein PsYK624_107260 [Phanerochaete sordida]|uniref:Transmembrane protein n=1 Tax=Phanerochaete sordida TaxID=48140 RepID=A0A9P3LGH0_9APHY|nr:hypothetical protein PsYK624_107260 [Phanerochaete sordida]